MNEIIINWIGKPLAKQFWCKSIQDLYSLDNKIEELIEFEIRAKIVEYLLEHPNNYAVYIEAYLTTLVGESKEKSFAGVEATWTFKQVLKRVIKMFNLEDKLTIDLYE